MRINKHDTNGVKPLLGKGELGYDDYVAGGDVGRVYVGTGSENIALAEKSEVDLHAGRTDNPHSVTKAQVGLGNVDNTSDTDKPVSTATSNVLATKVDKVTSTDNAIVRFDGTSGEVQNSGVIIDDAGNVIIPKSIRTDEGGTTKIGNYGVSGFEGFIEPYDINGFTTLTNTVGTAGFRVKTGGQERLRIDSAGNVSVGNLATDNWAGFNVVTLSSPYSSSKGGITSGGGGTNNNFLFNNCYYNNGWKHSYAGSYPATLHEYGSGKFIWYSAASDTGGNTADFNVDMILTGGKLGIGTLNPVFNVDTLGGSGNGYRYSNGTTDVIMGVSAGRGQVGTLTNDNLQLLVGGTEKATITPAGNMLVGTQVDNGVDKLQVNGSIGVSSIKTDDYFEIGKDYPFGDYTGIQGTKNPASMLVMIGGNNLAGAGRSALYLVNLKVLAGNATTSAIRIAGDDGISATFSYVKPDIFRVTDTSSDVAYNWRYIGGYN